MSGSSWDLLRRQIAGGEVEQAVKSAKNISGTKTSAFADYVGAIHHAINAGQPDVALILLEGSRRFLVAADAATFSPMMREMTAVLAACRREKQEEPARKTVALGLQLFGSSKCPATQDAHLVVAQFAGWAGRFALLCNDDAWFGEIALQTAGWAARDSCGQSNEVFLLAFDLWLHRILRQTRSESIPVVFDALSILCTEGPGKKGILSAFLPEWRVVAAMASLNPENPVASQLVEQLLFFAIRSGDPELWSLVSEKIGEVAALAVSKYGVSVSFSVFRPLLDVARINLGDELKFGTGPDPDNIRQHIIRRICNETLKIADMAAHTDISSVSGDKIEEMYRTWVKDPQFEPHIRSIQRFCQLLLIYWSNNRKRAAKRWTPREKSLSEPLLLTEQDQTKLSFLL
jgi:hypothetical protein